MFEQIVSELLGPQVPFTVQPPEEHVDEDTGEVLPGNPRLIIGPGLTIELAPEQLIIDGDSEDAVIAPLVAFGLRLRRIYELTERLSRTLELADRSVTVTVAPPADGPAWRADGLWVRLAIAGADSALAGGEDLLFISAELLDRPDFDALLWEYTARIADLDGSPPIELHDLTFAANRRPPDDAEFPRLVAALGLVDAAALRARVESTLARALITLEEVRDRYTRIYALPLPSGLALAAALVALLGELPDEAPGTSPYYSAGEPGWRRGSRWLEAAIAMRSAGLLDWFAPGGLQRTPVAIAQLLPERTPPEAGLLDPRLDMRYFGDAPQLVTFMSGDSDGLHWGLWYDSPQFYPCIAHNYARDSAETWIDEEATIPQLLRSKVASGLEDSVSELRSAAEEDRGFPLSRWRTLRIVEMILTELERAVAQQPAHEEPGCPWPRSDWNPIGSPRLALPPGSGAVPDSVPGPYAMEEPTTAALTAQIAAARTALTGGAPAFAHALGLYLHWRGSEELRAESAALLGEAYRALGFTAFAEILDVHVRYRDLGSVDVLKDS